MSKNLTDKKRLSKVESTRKTFKIFAVSFHGTNLEVMEKELVRQMEVYSSKKIYAVMVNATELEHQAHHQIEEGIQRCKKDFESVWESLTSTLSEDLRKYWSGDMEKVGRESESRDGDKSFESLTEEILPKKIKKSDLQILNSELNEDVETWDYFIVLFGKFSTDTLLKLLLSSQPLQAIIHFIPCPESDLEVNFPKLHRDIDFLRKSPDTKNVGIFIETLIQVPVAITTATTTTTISTTSEYLVEQEKQKYSQQIYDQFTWYLYDIEMLTQQFIVYQTDFVQINDAELPSQEELLWFKFVQLEVESNEDTTCTINDDTPVAVGVFLDNLFSAIENYANLERKSSTCHLSPFLENNYGKIIVEEANELLRSAVANQLNVVTYWKLANVVVNMVTSSVGGRHIEIIGIELPAFYELLSWKSFIQRLEAEKTFYDKCCHIYMTDDCKLFILQKSFNKVVEVRKKLQLPTKLCLRDFCKCIAPDLADFLRNFVVQNNGNNSPYNSKRCPKFSGLVFNDVLQELTIFEKIFRYEDGSISYSVENWSNEDWMVSVRMQILNNFIYFHPLKNFNSNSSKIRIVAKNNISCNIETNQYQHYPNIFLQWPNGCQIRYINEDNLKAFEQTYFSKNQSDIKRLYTSEGLVIRYLENGRIEVLTPNGVVYMLYVDNTSYTGFDFENSSQEGFYEEVSDEIYFVRNLEKYGIYCERFEVTLADGRKLRCSTIGNVLEEISNFMIYEWMDYCESKKFLDRDDGVKLVWSRDSLRCYYSCGTVITTTVVEDCIRTNFECETNIMDNIFENPNPTFVAKGANKAKRQDSYVTYNLNYLMQHKNYATVEVCGKDKMEIHSPDGLKLILKEDEEDDNHHAVVVVVLIDIGEELSIRIAAGVCTILSGVSIPQHKQIIMKLYLFPDATDILSFENQNAFLNIDANGEMKITEINSGLSPYKETLYLLAKHNSFGIEFFSKEKYDNFISNCKNMKYFYNSPTQTILLKSILPIDEQFSMLNSSEMNKDLKNFEPVVRHQPRSKLELWDRVFTARIINKLNGSSIKDTLAFVRNIKFKETTIENQLNAALKYFFGEKLKIENPKWKVKINAQQDESIYKKQRERIYNAMLKYNIFPKYYEFKNLNNDVKLINTDNLVQLNNLI